MGVSENINRNVKSLRSINKTSTVSTPSLMIAAPLDADKEALMVEDFNELSST